MRDLTEQELKNVQRTLDQLKEIRLSDELLSYDDQHRKRSFAQQAQPRTPAKHASNSRRHR